MAGLSKISPSMDRQPTMEAIKLLPPADRDDLADEPKGMFCHPISCCLQTLLCPLSFGTSCLASFFVLDVQSEAVILRFGNYERTVRKPGLHYSNVFGRSKRVISTKLQSMDLPAKSRTVMDREGNPLVISAVVTYQFVDSYKAALEVENPRTFLITQGETVLKDVMGQFPYEAAEGVPSLRTHSHEVSAMLRERLQALVHVSGIHVHSFGLKEISYAPVIAAAMLKRQQASAMVQARSTIVNGAVDIAASALNALKLNGVEMQEHESARLVSNLLTVICSDTDVQPTVPLS
ncbi:uncharacterized protein MONBRDRAFT_32461 [Monosiga brevicollis MX1]|uniref:Band 7 domain-containing protein n=1 Tax=Monosiga brevicollis TaxID=81824 RepID=A9UZM8_MONBE|nr:uncharacterized protein MONBRDRAFT_32461 [Monosiga brevicollis MX1]EDQ89395.1 predicted protein [Monosiga brevicollis MX1]|eukprot:XP_001745971.1 hypothetical protein [Monosiga brevicollis MX1]